MNKRSSLILGLVFMITLGSIALLPVKADFPENWDNYQSTTVNPLSWSFHTPTPSCFSGFVFNSNPPIRALSVPNYYDIKMNNVTGLCTPGSITQFYGSLTAQFNATNPATQLDMKYTTNFNVGGGVVSYWIYMKSFTPGNSLYSSGSVQKDLHPAFNNTWVDENLTIPSQPGGIVNITITLQLNSGSFGANAVNTGLDNLFVTGANIIIAGATVNLEDSYSRLQYNIASYPTSSFVINYLTATTCYPNFAQTASNQCTLNNLRTSYINVSLTGATLLTVHVDTLYARTLIPQSTVHVDMLLDNASKVEPYQITVTDLGQIFGSGSRIYINNTLAIITSGTLDQGASFAAPLIPGTYTVTLIQGTREFMSNLSLGTSVLAISIQITKYVEGSNAGPQASIYFVAYWGCNNTYIVANYNDHSNGTTHLLVLLYNSSATGVTLVYNFTFSGPLGIATSNFLHIVPSEGTYYVLFEPSLRTGFTVIGPVYLTPQNPSCPAGAPPVIPNTPSFPTSVFGLNQFTNDVGAWGSVMALVVCLMVGSIFGARHAALGYLIMAFTVLWFFLAGFFLGIGGVLSYTIIYGFILTAFIGFLIYRKRKPY